MGFPIMIIIHHSRITRCSTNYENQSARIPMKIAFINFTPLHCSVQCSILIMFGSPLVRFGRCNLNYFQCNFEHNTIDCCEGMHAAMLINLNQVICTTMKYQLPLHWANDAMSAHITYSQWSNEHYHYYYYWLRKLDEYGLCDVCACRVFRILIRIKSTACSPVSCRHVPGAWELFQHSSVRVLTRVE